MLVVNIISIMPMLVHMFVSDLILVLVPLLIQFIEISVSAIISSSGINNLNGSVTSTASCAKIELLLILALILASALT